MSRSKTRDARHRTHIPTRLRAAAGWDEGVILNVSARGLLVRMDRPPRNGTVIELRRGDQLIIARAVWIEDGLVGLRAQDTVDVAAFVASGKGAARTADDRQRDAAVLTRPAPGLIAAHSRWLAQTLQYGALLLAAALAAAGIASGLSSTLSRPLQAVSASLPGTEQPDESGYPTVESSPDAMANPLS